MTSFFKKLFIFITISIKATMLQASAPKIVVSIKPVHSIVAHVTEGVTEPVLLLEDGFSPHTFLLKPSHRKHIQDADLLIWVGENCETSLQKVIDHYEQKTLTLMQLKDISILPIRENRDFNIHSSDERAQADNDHHNHHHHANEDAHIWLSIHNAKHITQGIAQRLIEIDPQHSQQYQENAKHYLQKLTQLQTDIEMLFKQKKPSAYLVFHDAYQYFEHTFGLESAGTVLLNPHIPLTARAIHALQRLIEQYHISCIFYEPEYNHQPLKPILEKKGLSFYELDPLGTKQPKGLGCYEAIIRALATQLQRC